MQMVLSVINNYRIILIISLQLRYEDEDEDGRSWEPCTEW